MRILVTGASGFVGQVVWRSLRSEGHEVVGLSRRRPSDWQGDYIETDLGALAPLSSMLSGVDAVVHLASRVHHGNESSADLLPLYRQEITDATLHVAKEAFAAGAKRFVYLSSVKAVAESSSRRVLRVEGEPRPLDPYGISKLEAERGLRALTENTSLEFVALRPPLVYGPGVKANFFQLMKWVDRGIPLPFASIHNRRSLVYVENLASAIVSCLHARQLDGRSYFVSDREVFSSAGLIKAIATAMEKKPLLLPFPPSILSVLANVAGQSAKFQRLTEDLEVDASDFAKNYGWSPPHSAAEGFKATVQWYFGAKK